MFVPLAVYMLVSLAMVIAMAAMILKVGHLIGDCPQSGRAARAAAVTISTGYVMIGTGGVILIGALIPVMAFSAVAILTAVGLAAISLGLGFSHAVATLRAVVRDALAPQPATAATDAPTATAA